MEYKLINKYQNSNFSSVEQILLTRGVKEEDLYHFLHTTDNDICDCNLLGKANLTAAWQDIMLAISNAEDMLIIVDPDVDGFTSNSLFYNYLYDYFPAWADNHLHYWVHDGKQHGLSDCMTEAIKYKHVVCIDSSSNDYNEHKILKDNGTTVIVIDHHEADKISENAIIINNQLSNYPNKNFSGVGVVWQFCRWMEIKRGNTTFNKYLDLVALGNIADMMSMLSFETKHLIMKGLQNVTNPFFLTMTEENAYSMGNKITPHGVAWYVAPFINAICRSGTIENKRVVFEAFLNSKAQTKIPSTKRGHKAGDMEKVLVQAVRVAKSVKNKQDKIVNNAVENLDNKIKENPEYLNNAVLLFCVKPNEVDRNVAGLIANKLANKYQRPCCVLTEIIEPTGPTEDTPPWDEAWLHPDGMRISYQGSARGYDRSGITNFKDICQQAGVMYAEGHQGAFGLGLIEKDNFINFTNEELGDSFGKTIHLVDFIFQANDNNLQQKILNVAKIGDLWGKNLEENCVVIENAKITEDMVFVYSRGFVRIKLSNGLELIKKNVKEDEQNILKYENTNGIIVDIIGTCTINDYGGNVKPQVEIKDYNILSVAPKEDKKDIPIWLNF